jgi:hypothetical protein
MPNTRHRKTVLQALSGHVCTKIHMWKQQYVALMQTQHTVYMSSNMYIQNDMASVENYNSTVN